jgi:hypothetical protein
MADTREQLNTKITPATKALLAQYCQGYRTTQNDVVEAALLAWLQPKDGGDMQQLTLDLIRDIAVKQQSMDEGIAAMVPLLTSIVERLEAQQAEPGVPVARYSQIYDELQPPQPPVHTEVGNVDAGRTRSTSMAGWFRTALTRRRA